MCVEQFVESRTTDDQTITATHEILLGTYYDISVDPETDCGALVTADTLGSSSDREASRVNHQLRHERVCSCCDTDLLGPASSISR